MLLQLVKGNVEEIRSSRGRTRNFVFGSRQGLPCLSFVPLQLTSLSIKKVDHFGLASALYVECSHCSYKVPVFLCKKQFTIGPKGKLRAAGYDFSIN